MTKLLLCLFLAGCSAGIQPSLDFGPATDAAASDLELVDGGAPDDDSAPDVAEPDLGPDDASADLGPDDGPPPVDAGLPACMNTRELCADGRCCNEPCMGGICRFGHAVSGNFCTCDYVTCPDGATSCDNGLGGVCECP